MTAERGSDTSEPQDSFLSGIETEVEQLRRAMERYHAYCDLVQNDQEAGEPERRAAYEAVAEARECVKAISEATTESHRGDLAELLSQYPEVGFRPEMREFFLSAVGPDLFVRTERLASWEAFPLRRYALFVLAPGFIIAGAVSAVLQQYVGMLFLGLTGMLFAKIGWVDPFPWNRFPPEPKKGRKQSRAQSVSTAGALLAAVIAFAAVTWALETGFNSLGFLVFQAAAICIGKIIFRERKSPKFNFYHGVCVGGICSGFVAVIVYFTSLA